MSGGPTKPMKISKVRSDNLEKFISDGCTETAVVEIYTDGACKGNPGPGGFGALLKFGTKCKEISGYELDTTNNRMEMMAAIKALQSLKKPYIVKLYTDSQYLEQGITNWIYKWKNNNWLKSDRKAVKNADLWQELHEQVNKHEVTWKWVRGHSDNIGNNIADRLAVEAKNTAIELLSVINK